MQDVVAELAVGVKDLAGEDPGDWPAAALTGRLRGLVGVREGLELQVVRTLAGWDQDQAWALDGAVTPVSWLTHNFTMTTAEAAALMRLGRLYANHQAVADALDSGTLSLAHARVLGRAERNREDAFARCVDGLVELAAGLGLKEFTQVMGQWAELVDDRPPPEEDKRRFSVNDTIGGSAHGELFGSADDAAIIRAAIETLDTPDPIDAPEGPRTRLQRHYDIVIDIFRRVLADRLGDSLATPGSVDILLDADTAAELAAEHPLEDAFPGLLDPVPAETLAERLLRRQCRRADGTRARRAFAAALMCTGFVRRILIDPVTGDVLNIGRAQRRFNRRQRLALIIRDGGCMFPGCDRGPKWCDAHHLRPWEDGGPTDLANGCLLCRRHHTLIHSGGWTLARDPATGVFTATGPDGRRHTRRPTARV